MFDDYTDICATYCEKYGKEFTVVLIEVGSFWEVYDCDQRKGADMKMISELLNIQISKKNKNIAEVSSTNPLMAGFPSYTLDKYLSILIDNNMTVVLVGQTTPPPNPKREVTHIYSKGTYLPDGDSSTDNNIFSIYIEKIKENYILGIGCINISTGSSFVDEQSSTQTDKMLPFDNLYKHISCYKPCEIIIFGNDTIFLQKYLNSMGVTTRIIDMGEQKNVSSLSFQKHILEKCYDNQSVLTVIELLELEKNSHATQALTFLVQYCFEHNSSVMTKIARPEVYCGTKETNQSLNISFNSGDQLDITGLDKILNRCKTSIGKRYFRKRLFKPQRNGVEIRESLDIIESMISNQTYKQVRDTLSQVYDIEKIMRRLHSIRSNVLTDIENLYKSVIALETNIPEASHIKDFIATYFDFSRSPSPIHTHVSPKLTEYHEYIVDIEVKRKNLLDQINTNHGHFKLEKTEREGYYLSITKKRYNDLKHVIEKDSDFYKVTTNTTNVKMRYKMFDLYTEMEEDTKKEIQTLTDEVLRCFVLKLYEFSDCVTAIIHRIEIIDYASTCAHNAIEFKYVKPRILETSTSSIEMTAVRHPIIERILDDTEYITNDVTFESNGMLLYGINAAGKSSLMKAVGLGIIMAQAGMYVPCDTMTISPYTELFCRIQKGDNLYAGQSTFMIEMLELRNIMKRCTKNSFVIGDELCSGTESVSAISIVAAGIASLTKVGSAFMFATHLHELVDIDIVRNIDALRIVHLDVQYDKQNDMLVYNRRLAPGNGSRIYGLEVCKSFDMTPDFLNIADSVRRTLINATVKKSRYNSKKIIDKCVVCQKKGEHVHHIKEQQTADIDGYIGHMHKNHKSNLVCLCAACHDDVHHGNLDIGSYKMTSKGVKLMKSEFQN
jgi:DNA mismatch repair protein MutS